MAIILIISWVALIEFVRDDTTHTEENKIEWQRSEHELNKVLCVDIPHDEPICRQYKISIDM